MSKKRQKNILFIIACLCVLVRVCFVTFSGILEPGMQNDMGSLNENCFGHLGYIYYLANGGDVIHNGADIHYQFYHPPLHYMISAFWLKLAMSFGASLLAAAESIQILTCIYSVLTLLFVDKIVRRLGGDIKERAATLCLAGFFPYAVFMSGSINNDSLALLFMVMTCYFLLAYYEKNTMKNAILLGICFGLAIMSKMSALILGPGMAFLLIFLFIKNSKEAKKLKQYVVQYICIGLSSAGLGLWYPIKNYVVYGMDLLYIPRLELDSEQYIGHIPVMSRFLDFDPGQLTTLGLVFNAENGQLDHNIFLSLLKYSVFAESEYYLAAESVSRILFWIFAALLATVSGMALYMLLKAQWKKEYKITTALFYGANMFSYLRFCFTHPHVCTMHVRYIMLAVLLTMICAGFFKARKKESYKIWVGMLGMYVMTAVSFIGIFFGGLF